MTVFLCVLAARDKAYALGSLAAHLRRGEPASCCYLVEPESFEALPTAPFTYWATKRQLTLGHCFKPFEPLHGSVRVGVQTDDDMRFVRLYWEPPTHEVAPMGCSKKWVPFLKGGGSVPFFFDYPLVLNWHSSGLELKTATSEAPGGRVNNEADFGRPGFSWAVRTRTFQPHVVQSGCIPSVSRYLAMSSSQSPMAVLGLLNSTVVDAQCKLRMEQSEAPKFIPGVIKQVPIPDSDCQQERALDTLGQEGFRAVRTLDTVAETSHAFLLPALLRPRLGPYDPLTIEAELARIQQEIDDICFDLYAFDEADRAAMTETSGCRGETAVSEGGDDQEDVDDGDEGVPADAQSALLSWCVGVAFSRFDIRLATGERTMSPEPGSFDPLPAKSPGMLPDGVEPFHTHTGILVDDKGDPHDLAQLVEDVLEQIDTQVPVTVRDWLQRDFFAFHLKQYSKSRRKAPIYWPLSTKSGDYTLWVYYPSLTDQTLYTAVNDFVEPKLKQVIAQATTLNARGPNPTRDEEKKLEELEDMEEKLTDLRDALLKIAPTYHPDQDDGVQITAAPLWPLFRHRPWQKLLKETWTKLEKGDYDWAHLALHYWPDRVREKCKTDKSLAIAHGLEDLYVEPEIQARRTRTRRQ